MTDVEKLIEVTAKALHMKHARKSWADIAEPQRKRWRERARELICGDRLGRKLDHLLWRDVDAAWR